MSRSELEMLACNAVRIAVLASKSSGPLGEGPSTVSRVAAALINAAATNQEFLDALLIKEAPSK